ncbi:hypothetical protein [Vibrio sp. TBV020]|uniref:hypothetical protein n=1 Tax=Vibrio sp. TBV020 TaxID=3137398 RepID=UPI0038CD3EBF
MPKDKEKKIANVINNMLKFNAEPTSACVRQRLEFLGIEKSDINHHIRLLYQEGKISDLAQIERDTEKYLRAFHGRKRAEEQLLASQYNTEQISLVLDSLYSNIDEFNLALNCKVEKFGTGLPQSDEQRSQIVFYLQRQGHKLPIVLQLLKEE